MFFKMQGTFRPSIKIIKFTVAQIHFWACNEQLQEIYTSVYLK